MTYSQKYADLCRQRAYERGTVEQLVAPYIAHLPEPRKPLDPVLFKRLMGQ